MINNNNCVLVIYRMEQLDLLNKKRMFTLKCGFDDRRDRQLVCDTDDEGEVWHECDDGGGSVVDQDYINDCGPLLIS